MAVLIRGILVLSALLVVVCIVRGLVRRVRPVREGAALRAHATLLKALDGVIRALRRVAYPGVAIILVLAVVKIARLQNG